MTLIFACLLAVAVDGDTLRCPAVESDGAREAVAALRADLDRVNHRVRLARIDAPERGERGSDEASQALAKLIEGRVVTCELVEADARMSGFQRHDIYGRPVARCSAGGRDLATVLLAHKYADKWP